MQMPVLTNDSQQVCFKLFKCCLVLQSQPEGTALTSTVLLTTSNTHSHNSLHPSLTPPEHTPLLPSTRNTPSPSQHISPTKHPPSLPASSTTHLAGRLSPADGGLEVADQCPQEVQQVGASDAACCHGNQPAQDLDDRCGDECIHGVFGQVVQEGLQDQVLKLGLVPAGGGEGESRGRVGSASRHSCSSQGQLCTSVALRTFSIKVMTNLESPIQQWLLSQCLWGGPCNHTSRTHLS